MTVGLACTALRLLSIAALAYHCEGFVQQLPSTRKWNPSCFSKPVNTFERRTKDIQWSGGQLLPGMSGRASRYGLCMALGDYYDDDEISWSVSLMTFPSPLCPILWSTMLVLHENTNASMGAEAHASQVFRIRIFLSKIKYAKQGRKKNTMEAFRPHMCDSCDIH
jgi:hypothetical protein